MPNSACVRSWTNVWSVNTRHMAQEGVHRIYNRFENGQGITSNTTLIRVPKAMIKTAFEWRWNPWVQMKVVYEGSVPDSNKDIPSYVVESKRNPEDCTKK